MVCILSVGCSKCKVPPAKGGSGLNALADEALADSAAGATKTPRSPRPGHHAHIGLLPVACEVFPLGLDQREAFTLRTHRGAIDRGSLRHRSRSGRGITVTLSATG